MTIVNGYLTTDEAIEYVGRNGVADTASLDDVVTAVSRMIDRYCGRHFYTTSGTRVFDAVRGRNDRVEFGPYNDLVSITTLKSDDNDDGAFEVTYSAANYQLLPLNALQAPEQRPYESVQLLSAVTFPTLSSSGRIGLVQVVGTWGWPSVPLGVKQAARILTAEVAKLADAPLGVAGFSDFGVFRVGAQIPPRARTLLDPYRHPLHVGLA